VHFDILLGDLGLERQDNLADMLIWILRSLQLWLEFIFPDLHPLDLVGIVEPHRLAGLLNGLKDFESLLSIDLSLLATLLIILHFEILDDVLEDLCKPFAHDLRLCEDAVQRCHLLM
jgi:hypothetical protein